MTNEELEHILLLSEEEKVNILIEFTKDMKKVIEQINSEGDDFYKIYLDKASYITEFIDCAFSTGNMDNLLNGTKYSKKARSLICTHNTTPKKDLVDSLNKLSKVCYECAQEIKKHGDGRIHI